MSFAHPSLFWLGLIVAGAVWAGYCYSARQRRKLLERFASPRLLEELTASVSPARRSAKQWLVIASIILLFAALARPQAGYTWQEAKRRGHDIMFAVDTSRSMLTPDMSPDRLTRAKLAILDTLEKLDGDRVGLIAFAGGAFLQCPLTIDYNAFRQTVEALDTNTIPRGGTDLAGAIKEAIGAMAGSQGDKTLIILTDGEETEGNALQFARQAAEKGIRIFTVGVGTPSGAVIPLRNPDGSTGLVRDPAGQPVRSRLNETLLKQIAETTGGFYIQLTAQSRGLQEILSDGLGNVEKQEIAEKMTRVPIDRFQIPLALAILLLLIEFILSERRKRLPLLTQPGGGRKPPRFFCWDSLLLDIPPSWPIPARRPGSIKRANSRRRANCMNPPPRKIQKMRACTSMRALPPIERAILTPLNPIFRPR
ncbi:VWA domain-containing protein [Kamptonema cortianum]|nr:VWA domain-containing protein [Kamptonema cortianum]